MFTCCAYPKILAKQLAKWIHQILTFTQGVCTICLVHYQLLSLDIVYISFIGEDMTLPEEIPHTFGLLGCKLYV